jgi:hypothetical protein
MVELVEFEFKTCLKIMPVKNVPKIELCAFFPVM